MSLDSQGMEKLITCVDPHMSCSLVLTPQVESPLEAQLLLA